MKGKIVILIMSMIVVFLLFDVISYHNNSEVFMEGIQSKLVSHEKLSVLDIKELLEESNYQYQLDEFIFGEVDSFSIPYLDSGLLRFDVRTEHKVSPYEFYVNDIYLFDIDSGLLKEIDVHKGKLYYMSMEIEDVECINGSSIFILKERRGRIGDHHIVVIVIDSLRS